jgi:hypothetical protein
MPRRRLFTILSVLLILLGAGTIALWVRSHACTDEVGWGREHGDGYLTWGCESDRGLLVFRSMSLPRRLNNGALYNGPFSFIGGYLHTHVARPQPFTVRLSGPSAPYLALPHYALAIIFGLLATACLAIARRRIRK